MTNSHSTLLTCVHTNNSHIRLLPQINSSIRNLMTDQGLYNIYYLHVSSWGPTQLLVYNDRTINVNNNLRTLFTFKK